MKVLITGFEKFGDYNENITEIMSRKKKLGAHDIEGLVFPVRIFSDNAEKFGEIIVKKAQEIGAEAIISLGMASDVFGLRIETRSINWTYNKKYCLASEQNKVLDNRFPPTIELKSNLDKWDLGKIILGLRDAELAHEDKLSYDANNFCCNALFFRTLQAFKDLQCEIPYIFLHVSCSPEAVRGIKGFDRGKCLISVEDLEKSLLIFIDNLKVKYY